MPDKSIKELEKEWSALVDAFLKSQDGQLLSFTLLADEWEELCEMLKGYANLLESDNAEAAKHFSDIRQKVIERSMEIIGRDRAIRLRKRTADLSRQILHKRTIRSLPDPLETKPAPPGWEKALPEEQCALPLTSSPPTNYKRIVARSSSLRRSSISGLWQLLGDGTECLPQASALHYVPTEPGNSSSETTDEGPVSSAPQEGDDSKSGKT